MNKVVLRDHPWPSVITVVVGTAAELNRYIKARTDCDEEMEHCHGRYDYYTDGAGQRHDLIAVKRAGTKSDRTATLAHEATHLAHALLDQNCGMPMKEDSDEAYAYLIGWVVKRGIRIL